MVTVFGNGRVTDFGNGRVTDFGNGRVTVFGNGRVTFLGNGRVTVFGNGYSFQQLLKMPIVDMNFSTKAIHTISKGVDSLWSNRTQ